MSHQIPFLAECSIDNNRIVVRAIVDKKNNSIHLHLYGEMFGNKRTPIQAKHSDIEIKEGKDAGLITQVLTEHFSNQPFQVNSIKKADREEASETGHPLRIIIRGLKEGIAKGKR